MFCTNCGEQMRDTDKFCAECGAPAAPRAAKKRAEAGTPMEQPAPPRAPRSTVEGYHAPLRATPSSAGATAQPELGFATPAQPTPPAPVPAARPAPPVRMPQAPQPPLSDEEEHQVLLEGEEIASVRGRVPVEALPEIVPVQQPRRAAQHAATMQICTSCGKVNPAGNRFCEGCGRTLQGAPAPAATPQSGWLGDAPPAAPAAPVATTTPPPATATETDDNFFYYYNDKAAHHGHRKLLVVLLIVLVLAIGGVAYLMLRPPAKNAGAGNVVVTISPTEAIVTPGGTQDFSATVSGSGDSDVTWSVEEGNAGGTMVNRGAQAEAGTVETMAIYAAPATPGTYHVVATSKADPAKSATAEVTVK
jgi:hypothetical protein